jgi:hypothetical protein
MTLKLVLMTLSQREIRDGVGLLGFWPQITFMPAASNALFVLVRDARSISDCRRSQSGPVIPGGQASSTGAGNSST